MGVFDNFKIAESHLNNIDTNPQLSFAQKIISGVPNVQNVSSYLAPPNYLDFNKSFKHDWNAASRSIQQQPSQQQTQQQQQVSQQQTQQQTSQQQTSQQQTNTGNQIIARGVDMVGQFGANQLSNKLFDQSSDWGRGLGTLFSQGSSAAMGRLSSNIMKGQFLTEGLGQDVGASLAGAAAGLAGNYIGRGISSLGGNSMLSRGIGAGTGTAIGSVGGTVLSNAVKGKALLTGLTNGMSIGGLAGSVVGAGLQAAFGPSKEYAGKYGNLTRTADTIYDVVQSAAGFFGPVGALVSGGMALNKGLSNIFGSTDGMTKTDAILGSAFMGAPVKWLNMAGANTTGNFNNQSWQNMEKANSFMGNAFGDLASNFDKARQEAGKTYGTFSKSAYKDAQRNIDFANYAWDKIMAMADQNELQNIRSQYMSSINNQRYAQDIQGAWQPIYRGKSGMKIFNNATNHNMGMRLLSAAALIDSKQMILCSVVD